jgi:hypothetical protein
MAIAYQWILGKERSFGDVSLKVGATTASRFDCYVLLDLQFHIDFPAFSLIQRPLNHPQKDCIH